ncbi:sensor histidine kinase [Streptomyces silvensis]|uniref:histidine kinase n=1 Tax=Streptomyces silvensis TaxID=1765722 RepID=A0A0W7X7B6_9ACTN|nr:sensor histidine kinase [Streptomyces silvensis]KUF18719.1 histidine kinase [Streptomyces silvensis]
MLSSWRRYADRCPRLVETAFLALLCAATGAQNDRGPGWWPGLLITTTSCLALLWRHTRPGPVVASTAISAALLGALGYPVDVLLLLPLMVAMYALTVVAPQRTVRVYCVAAIVVVALAGLSSDRNDESWQGKTVVPAFWISLSVVQGTNVRTRRAHLNAVRARAEHAERTREDEARHRVAEERVRIARELHDVVAHHMALAHAQAGTAAHLARTRPDEAGRILGELTGTTSAALRELQATVGLLRRPEEPEDVLEPAPGLARLPELVSAFASAGLRVVVTVDGEERTLSPGTDLTAFRIVQEALTNVAKHASADTAQVRLAYAQDLLTLTVRDHGGAVSRPSAAGGGFGVIGMRERARAAGGRLDAGRHPEGGYAVTAELPLHP